MGAPCVQTDTVTPVIGIAVQTYLDGDYYVEYTDALKAALQTAGFKVHAEYEYPLPDLASILIKGRVDAWTTRSGNRSHRVGKVNLDVTDIGSEETVLTIRQIQAPLVFMAPTSADFAADVAKAISMHYCQVR